MKSSSKCPCVVAVTWAAFVGGLGACDKAAAPTTPAPPVSPVPASITITPLLGAVCPADTVRLQATVRTSGGEAVPGITLTWTSSAPAVATVDQAGLVRTVSGGVTVIKAATGAVSAVVSLAVRSPRITVGYRYPSLFVNDTAQVQVSIADTTSSESPFAPSSWSSRAPAVASVSPSGVVTGRGPGTSEIVAQGLCGREAAVTVTVLEPRIGTNRELSYLYEGQSYRYLGKTIQPNGTGGRLVSGPNDSVDGYAWSRDGSRVVFSYVGVNGDGRIGSFVYNPDGSGEIDLHEHLWNPDWSPDGTRIAYRNYVSSGESDIYTMRPDGSDVRRLSTSAGDDLEPKWSPDGRQLLYVRPNGTKQDLWLVASDSADRRRIALPMSVLHPQWSPDGKSIVFDNGSGIFAVNVDGSRWRSLTSNCTADGACTGTEYRYGSFSPDGQRLTYSGGNAVWLAKADGTGATSFNFAVGECCGDVNPVWSPDGTRVGFLSIEAQFFTTSGVAIIGPGGMTWTALGPVIGRLAWRP